MKPVLWGCGLTLALLVGGVIWLGIYLYGFASEHDAMAILYLEAAVPEIATWELERARPFLADEMLAGPGAAQVGAALRLFSRLGQFRRMGAPSVRRVATHTAPETGTVTTLVYAIEVAHEKGNAVWTVALMVREGRYAIRNVNIKAKGVFGDGPVPGLAPGQKESEA